ncbi:hypothetical protein NMG60_11037036 [Bertholletia excelsa]
MSHLVNSTKHNKKRLTEEQVRLLETSFSSNKRLEPERKLQLARELGVPPRKIAIWYQNKRARWKAQSLELDHGALRLRLDAALADKRRLEREVERLRGELDATQAALLQALKPPPVSNSLCSGEERESSGVQEDVISCSNKWVRNHVSEQEVLQLDELYACLVGVHGSKCA